MTKKEYLLECLAEEACEIAQAKSKVIRFGEDNEWPGYNGTALTRLCTEINDFYGVLELLVEEIQAMKFYLPNRDEIEAKKRKVMDMMEYSRQRGIIKDTQ